VVRWGAPRRYDFGVDLDRVISRESVQPFIEDIAWFLTDVDVLQRNGRTICVGLGQWDKEFPKQLVLVVGQLPLG
jgi:hypothetical protein